jgi:hypothetical protein
MIPNGRITRQPWSGCTLGTTRTAATEGYGVQGTTVYYRLAQEGYKVVMYDQFGFGDHLTDAIGFYERHPHWSKLGRAVYDVSRVIDFLVEGQGVAAEPVPPTDPKEILSLRVCLRRHGRAICNSARRPHRRLGLLQRLYANANRHDDQPTGGIRRFWEWHALLPKLGLFHQREQSLQYDYDDLFAFDRSAQMLDLRPDSRSLL